MAQLAFSTREILCVVEQTMHMKHLGSLYTISKAEGVAGWGVEVIRQDRSIFHIPLLFKVAKRNVTHTRYSLFFGFVLEKSPIF